jgi:molecular chaperone DnaK (HSP70)
VKKRVAEHFEREPRCDLNPDEVVAMGAGMLAGLGPNAQLKDVLPMTIGVGIKGKFQPVIPANTQVPCMQSITLKIKHADLATTQLDLFQGDAPELHKNEFLGSIKLDVLTPRGSDPMPVQVDLLLSADCLLKVRLRNSETDESHQVLLSTRD